MIWAVIAALAPILPNEFSFLVLISLNRSLFNTDDAPLNLFIFHG